MAFWTSWALWEKMCFVLGCAIVLTILAGCVKLVHKHRQLRRYTAIAAKKKEEQQEIQHAAQLQRGRGVPIPFGVRAIESGIEVDGVWISRTNTPSSTRPGSPTASIPTEPNLAEASHSYQPKASAKNIDLAMPQPVCSYSGVSSNRSSLRSASQDSFERATSAERLPGRNVSPPSETTPRIRPTYRPRQSSHLRFSSGDIIGDMTRTDEQKGKRATSSESSDDSNSPSGSRSSSEIEYAARHYVPLPPHNTDNSTEPRQSASHQGFDEAPPSIYNSDKELESLANHRKSHAAEMGQLLRRDRTGGANDDWTSTRSLSADRSNSFDFFPGVKITAPEDPFTTPAKIPVNEPDPAEPPTFQSFLDSDPTNTQRHSIPLMDYVVEKEHQDVAQPLQNGNTNQQLRQSQVVRKINSGFEILQPGTLDRARQGSDITDVKPEFEYGNKRQSRKLHKKNPSESTNKKLSHFVEEV
ncbi:MAG: hypothetical protein Q9187_003231 [Circinaria calcarea]